MTTPTYEAIAYKTTTSDSSSYTITSIPQTYTHLIMHISASKTGTGNTNGYIYINGDGTSTDNVWLYGQGTTSDSEYQANASGRMSYSGEIIGSGKRSQYWIVFPNYTGTSWWKSFLSYNGNGDEERITVSQSTLRETGAITSIQFRADATLDGDGTQIALYGVH